METKYEFFKKMSELGISLTYGDVRLKTGYSICLPEQVNTSTLFSRNVSLKIPLVSAAMDTVTERAMAIRLALEGGLGIIHRGLTPEKQVDEVDAVKFHLNGLIETPIVVHPEDIVQNILNRCKEKGWEFRSFPVTDQEGHLVGIVTETDFKHCDQPSVTISEIMSKNLFTCPVGTTIVQAKALMDQVPKHNVLPVVDQGGKIAGLYVYSDVKRILSGGLGKCNLDEKNRLRVGAAIGSGPKAIERAELLVRKSVDVLVIDTAHADTKDVSETIHTLKQMFDIDIVVGNISEPDSARRLAEAGADGIKVGQGPGSICTTRIIAGIGAPQLTAIYECAQAVKEFNIPIIADGGIQYSGDIPVAIGAGASSVMIGQLFSGTDEAPGEIVMMDGRQWKIYRGMGSLSALEELETSRERYLQPDPKFSPIIPEGIEGRVPYRGPAKTIIDMLIGGLRKGMGYVGAASIAELQNKASFRKHSASAQAEGRPYIPMIKEPPNYHPEED